MPKYDIQSVKSAAAGRWTEILPAIAGIDPSILDGFHHPCPKCGGKDRFRFIDANAGAVLCSQCFNDKNGDGIAAVEWMRGIEFPEALALVGDYLGFDREGYTPPLPTPKPTQPVKKISDPELCHLVYSKLAETFGLNEKHRSDLHQRGLTDDEIAYRGYWSAPGRGIDTIRLASLFTDRETIAEKVPGVFPGGAIKVAATDALMIPVRSPDGNIIGIQYRIDKPTKSGGKYLWLSSKNAGGPSSGAPAHTALPPRTEHDPSSLRITEGPLKADVATFLSGVRTVGAAGVNNWKSMIDPVEQINPGKLILSFDKDAETNPGVAESAVKSYDHFVTGQSLVYVEDWPESQKGIDDALLHLRSEVKILELEAGAKKIDNLRRFVHEDEQHEHPDDPHRLSRVNLANYKDKGRTLRYWKGGWYSYKGTRYVEIDKDYLEARIAASIKQEFDRLQKEERQAYLEWKKSKDYDEKKDKGSPKARKISNPLTNNVMLATKSECVLSSSVSMSSWLPDRSQPHYVACSNGIIDMDALFSEDDNPLLPHSPDWFSMFCLDYPFDPDAECPLWCQFIESAMEGDKQRIAILQEWAGYLLSLNNKYQRFLAMEGDGGNGKTVFAAGLTAMIGIENTSRVSLEKFGGQFDLAATIGKAVNICGDVGEIDKAAEAELKQFTGGDVMQFDRKKISPITIKPTAKLMMSWNQRPNFRDRSDGLWRRMILIPFNKKPTKLIRGMDEHQWWIDNGEAPGIFLWAIEGLRRLRDQNEFTKSNLSKELMDEYKLSANPAAEFLDSFIEECPDSKIERQRLYDFYQHYCHKTGHKYPLVINSFGKEVFRKFPNTKLGKISGGGKRENAYVGVKFSTEEIFSRSTADEKLF